MFTNAAKFTYIFNGFGVAALAERAVEVEDIEGVGFIVREHWYFSLFFFWA